jgi:hypothetical protein
VQKKQKAADGDAAIDQVDEFTPAQRFFLSWAQVRPESRVNFLSYSTFVLTSSTAVLETKAKLRLTVVLDPEHAVTFSDSCMSLPLNGSGESCIRRIPIYQAYEKVDASARTQSSFFPPLSPSRHSDLIEESSNSDQVLDAYVWRSER